MIRNRILCFFNFLGKKVIFVEVVNGYRGYTHSITLVYFYFEQETEVKLGFFCFTSIKTPCFAKYCMIV